MIFLKYNISFKDKAFNYLYSSNINIFKILDYINLLSLKGHKSNVRTIRYLINYKNYNEFQVIIIKWLLYRILKIIILILFNKI